MRPALTARRLAEALVAALAAVLLGACGGTASPGTSASSVAVSTAATSSQPVALDQLAGFVSGAQAADTALTAAAARVNSGITTQSIRIDSATVQAVAAITPQRLKSLIPGGLADELLRPALLAYSDLVSRRDALNRISEYAGESPLPRTGAHARELLSCLGNGAAAAANFATDLARLRSAAQVMNPVAVAPATSRATAEVAIRTTLVDGANGGCASCGGQVDRTATLWPITWTRTELTPGDVWDGAIGTMLFRARYAATSGWSVQLNAC